MKDGDTKKIMDRMLICDIEQNLYRGALRKFDGTPFTYYLFISKREYRALIHKLAEKYEKLGANIQLLNAAQTRSDMFYEFYDSLDVGALYTGGDIADAIGYDKSKRLRDFYKDYPDIQKILENDRVKGHRTSILRAGKIRGDTLYNIQPSPLNFYQADMPNFGKIELFSCSGFLFTLSSYAMTISGFHSFLNVVLRVMQ